MSNEIQRTYTFKNAGKAGGQDSRSGMSIMRLMMSCISHSALKNVMLKALILRRFRCGTCRMRI